MSNKRKAGKHPALGVPYGRGLKENLLDTQILQVHDETITTITGRVNYVGRPMPKELLAINHEICRQINRALLLDAINGTPQSVYGYAITRAAQGMTHTLLAYGSVSCTPEEGRKILRRADWIFDRLMRVRAKRGVTGG